MYSREWNGLEVGVKKVLEAHQRDVPVKVGQIARILGVAVSAATLAPGISGEIRPDGPGKFMIKVNRHDSPNRQRFTVAHEIAHFLLHRAQIGTGITDDVLYRSSLSDSREAEANRLAADILMPLELVRRKRELAGNLTDEELAGHLADVFGVSTVAMQIRLGMR